MPVQIKYDPRYKPSPEVLRLLELSWLEVEEMEKTRSQMSHLRLPHRRCVCGPYRTRRGQVPEV